MSGTLVAALYALSGVCAYAALHHGLAVIRRQVYVNHLLFALLCLLVAAFILIKAQAYGAHTAQALVTARRWEFSVLCLFFIVFPWFVAEYARIRPRKFLIGVTVFWVVLLCANLLLPYGVKFIDVPRLTYLHLPWGESVTDLRVRLPSVWQKAAWLGIFAVIVYSFFASIVQFRRGDKRRARTLGYALTLVSGFALFDLAVNENLIEFVHTGELGFVALLVLMDLEMMVDAREQKRRMRGALDHMPAAVCLKDLQGRYLMVNRRFENYFHVKEADVIGKTVFDRFPREHAETVRASELLACKTRQEIVSEERLEYNGKKHIFHSIKFPLLRADGMVYAIGGVTTDITESQRRDEALERFRHQVWHVDRVASTGAITGSLAHELCQPLAAILNNAQAGLRFLARDNPDLGEIREILQDIARDDKRAGAVINGLRALLQKQDTPYTELDLGQCIGEVIDLMHSEILKKSVDIERQLDAGLTVRANRTQIQQVALNLMLNAIEAMMDEAVGERCLRIGVTRADDKALVSIRDNGIGIPQDMLDRVFDGFYTTKPQGLGVGLEVCRSIIESHHGAIWVDPNPDRGVTFHFTLPHVAEYPTGV